MMADRDGLQAGAGQCALVNNTPLAASRSKFGVFACGCPPRQPIQSFKSSTEMNSTFGLSAATADDISASDINNANATGQ